MRAKIFAGIILPALLLFLLSCTKTVSYRSYKCYCTPETSGMDEEYTFQAKDRYEALLYCNDIEERVNNYNKQFDREFNCEVK